MQSNMNLIKYVLWILCGFIVSLINCDAVLSKELTIVFTGDINGHVEPCG